MIFGLISVTMLHNLFKSYNKTAHSYFLRVQWIIIFIYTLHFNKQYIFKFTLRYLLSLSIVPQSLKCMVTNSFIKMIFSLVNCIVMFVWFVVKWLTILKEVLNAQLSMYSLHCFSNLKDKENLYEINLVLYVTHQFLLRFINFSSAQTYV